MNISNIIKELPVHPTKRYGHRNLSRVHTVVVHHSASGRNVTAANMASYHVNHHGWPGLAYHYVIAPDGNVYKCNPISMLTYHAKGGNTSGIGVCCLGNFEVHDVPDAQYQALDDLITGIMVAMPQVVNVIGHRQVKGASTACPGARFTDAMLAGLS